jgi:hypothetical protein
MGKHKKYWEEHLEAYRIKKRIRQLRERMDLKELKEGLDCSKQYLNNWTRTYLPSQDFINRLEELENGND